MLFAKKIMTGEEMLEKIETKRFSAVTVYEDQLTQSAAVETTAQRVTRPDFYEVSARVAAKREAAKAAAQAAAQGNQTNKKLDSWEFPKKALFFTINAKVIIDQAPTSDYASELKEFVRDLSSRTEKEMLVVETVLDLIKDLKDIPAKIEIPFEDIIDFGEELTKSLIGGIILGLLTHYRQKAD